MLQSENQSVDSFWNQKATELLFVMISILKTQERKYQHLHGVAYLLDILQTKDQAEQYLYPLFAEFSNDRLFTTFQSIVSQSEKMLSNIISTAQTAVQQYALDENIAQITASDDFGDFKDIRRERTAMYIHSSTAKTRYYAKLSSIFLQQYFESFFEELPSKEDLDVSFILEECPILSINNLDLICANVRKYRGNMMVVGQNTQAQLTSKYGQKRAEAIVGNLRTKVYLSADLPTAKQLEQTIGQYEFVDQQDSEKMKNRSVLTVDEIMSLPTDKGLIWVSGMRPVLTRLKPYFKSRRLKKLTSLKPHSDIDSQPNTEIPLLPLKQMYPPKDEATD